MTVSTFPNQELINKLRPRLERERDRVLRCEGDPIRVERCILHHTPDGGVTDWHLGTLDDADGDFHHEAWANLMEGKPAHLLAYGRESTAIFRALWLIFIGTDTRDAEIQARRLIVGAFLAGHPLDDGQGNEWAGLTGYDVPRADWLIVLDAALDIVHEATWKDAFDGKDWGGVFPELEGVVELPEPEPARERPTRIMMTMAERREAAERIAEARREADPERKRLERIERLEAAVLGTVEALPRVDAAAIEAIVGKVLSDAMKTEPAPQPERLDAGTGKEFVPTDLQLRILEELERESMTARAMFEHLNELNLDDAPKDLRTLETAFAELKKAGKVGNRRGRGYFLRDAQTGE